MFTAKQIRRLLPACTMRLVALGCVALMVLLSLAAVSPGFHAALHGEPAQNGEHSENQAAPGHSCAVTLFSQGIESGHVPVAVLVAPALLITEVIALADQVARTARAAQLPPGRGPPAC